VKIPIAALIAEAKLTRYLLIPKDVDDKSKFLAQVGFLRENPASLDAALRQLIQREEAMYDTTNEYRDYYRVEGELVGPTGRLWVITIWIADAGDGSFRFVTLKPKR
jgi:hypothetical protein